MSATHSWHFWEISVFSLKALLLWLGSHVVRHTEASASIDACQAQFRIVHIDSWGLTIPGIQSRGGTWLGLTSGLLRWATPAFLTKMEAVPDPRQALAGSLFISSGELQARLGSHII